MWMLTYFNLRKKNTQKITWKVECWALDGFNICAYRACTYIHFDSTLDYIDVAWASSSMTFHDRVVHAYTHTYSRRYYTHFITFSAHFLLFVRAAFVQTLWLKRTHIQTHTQTHDIQRRNELIKTLAGIFGL